LGCIQSRELPCAAGRNGAHLRKRLRTWRNRGIYRGWTDEALDCFVKYAMTWRDSKYVLRCPVRLEADIFEHPLYCWTAFRQIRVPVLFLRGARSYPFFPQAERLQSGANPQIEVRQLPAAIASCRKTRASADAVRTFLTKHGL